MTRANLARTELCREKVGFGSSVFGVMSALHFLARLEKVGGEQNGKRRSVTELHKNTAKSQAAQENIVPPPMAVLFVL